MQKICKTHDMYQICKNLKMPAPETIITNNKTEKLKGSYGNIHNQLKPQMKKNLYNI